MVGMSMVFFPYWLRVGFFVFVWPLYLLTFWKRKRHLKPILNVNDKYLELMLIILDLFFTISKKFRKNLKDFNGTYVFATKDKEVCASAVFANNDMKVIDEEEKNYDLKIIFKDAETMREALRSIVLKGQLDILDFMLEDRIETDGNINYAFKFIFMINDLSRRLNFINWLRKD